MTILFAYRNTERHARPIVIPKPAAPPEPIKTKGRLALIELSRQYEQKRLEEMELAKAAAEIQMQEIRAAEVSRIMSDWTDELREIPRPTIRPSTILAQVAIKYRIEVADILGQSRHARLVKARNEATCRIYVECRDAFGPRLSLPVIGRIMRRDHSTQRRALILGGVYIKP